MIARDLANLLMRDPDAEVTLDIDDGLDGNFVPVLGATKRKTIMGEFIVIDADVHRILKKS